LEERGVVALLVLGGVDFEESGIHFVRSDAFSKNLCPVYHVRALDIDDSLALSFPRDHFTDPSLAPSFFSSKDALTVFLGEGFNE
jgi:hypothetical protein